MKKLETMQDRRNYFLNICDCIHSTCIQHGIKYSLAFGTLIGAKRHGGFIPWDDDFDIMMTRHEFEQFRKVFKDNRYKLLTPYLRNNYGFPFARVCDTNTYQKLGTTITGKQICGYGLSIDLYIVESVPDEHKKVKKLISDVMRLVKIRRALRFLKNKFRCLHLLSTSDNFFPLDFYSRRQEKLQRKYNGLSSSTCICFAGPQSNKTILCSEFFDDYEIVKFENREYMIISKYDQYLSFSYGDWRTPPPENKRIPYHGGTYYIKEHLTK